MSVIFYKLIKSYSLLHTKRGKKMDKNIKLVATIFLFVFLFFFTEEVVSLYDQSSNPTLTDIKCTSPKDCPDEVIAPNSFITCCLNGQCVKWLVSNE
jgi:hypothetical protein